VKAGFELVVPRYLSDQLAIADVSSIKGDASRHGITVTAGQIIEYDDLLTPSLKQCGYYASNVARAAG
jgi:hypothetical protein